jgi:hypothetical protein
MRYTTFVNRCLALLIALTLACAAGHAAFAAGDAYASAADSASTSTSTASAAVVSTACDDAARDCCHRISVTCIELKYRPLCDYPPHLCPVPYTPCGDVVCIEPPCHMPVATCYPEAPCGWCRPVCHKPAVVVIPEDPCEE